MIHFRANGAVMTLWAKSNNLARRHLDFYVTTALRDEINEGIRNKVINLTDHIWNDLNNG